MSDVEVEVEEEKSVQDRALDILEELEGQLNVLQAEIRVRIEKLLVDAGRRVEEALEDVSESLDDKLDTAEEDSEGGFSLPN